MCVTSKRASLILSNITPRLEPVWHSVGNEGVGLWGPVCSDCVLQTRSLRSTDTHVTSDLLNPASLSGLGTEVECEGCPAYRVTNGDIKFGFGRKQQNLPLRNTRKKKNTLKLDKLLFYRSEGERHQNKTYVDICKAFTGTQLTLPGCADSF